MLCRPEECIGSSILDVLAIQIVIKEVVQPPVDAHQRTDISLPFQAFNDLNYNLVGKTEECHPQHIESTLLISFLNAFRWCFRR